MADTGKLLPPNPLNTTSPNCPATGQQARRDRLNERLRGAQYVLPCDPPLRPTTRDPTDASSPDAQTCKTTRSTSTLPALTLPPRTRPSRRPRRRVGARQTPRPRGGGWGATRFRRARRDHGAHPPTRIRTVCPRRLRNLSSRSPRGSRSGLNRRRKMLYMRRDGRTHAKRNLQYQ